VDYINIIKGLNNPNHSAGVATTGYKTKQMKKLQNLFIVAKKSQVAYHG